MFSFEGTNPTKCGGDSKEDPPVPMPNTEVKLLNADGTWWATARESRKLPEPIFLYSSVGRAYVNKTTHKIELSELKFNKSRIGDKLPKLENIPR